MRSLAILVLALSVCAFETTMAAAAQPPSTAAQQAHGKNIDKVSRAAHKPKAKRHGKVTDPLQTAIGTGGSKIGAGAVGASPAVGGAWSFAGPRPITGTYTNSSGRVTALAVDPTNASLVYAGTAGGGVWKTTNAGTSWTPTSDGLPSLAIGAVAVDPNNHLVVYAGTGEANDSQDSQAGQGILKSTDGGNSWTMYGQGIFGGHFIYAIAVDRTNSNHVLVATSIGLYISSDGGANYSFAQSLFNLSPLTTTYDPRVDALIQDPDPAHSSRWYAAVDERCLASGFIGVSNDGGATWSQAWRASSVSSLPMIARFGMGEGSSGVLYTSLAACDSTTPAFTDGQLAGLLKSRDYGATWALSTTMPDLFSQTAEHQGWYDIAVAVDPTNSNRAVFGGITMLATTDGGSSFTDIAKPYSGGPIHPDFHAIAFTGANAFYAGNDGGVWSTSDLGGTGASSDWSNLNATLAITTFYGGAALDSSHMVGGAQDTGTSGLLPGGPTPPAWNELVGGDGGQTVMVPGTTTYYGEQFYDAIFKADYTNPGSAVAAGPCNASSDPACAEPVATIAPFVIDPANPSIVFTAGSHLYRSTTGGVPAGSGGWKQISGDLTQGTTYFSSGDFVSALGISPDGSLLVAGTANGNLWFVSNPTGTPTFTQISGLPAFDPNQFTGRPWITAITLPNCAASSCTADVSLGLLTSGRVWQVSSTAPPIDVTSNLSAIVSGVAVNGLLQTGDGLYAATDLGVYACWVCGAGGSIWFPVGAGLPDAQVDQVTLSADGADVIAWTHGRGAWTLPRLASSSLSSGTIDFGGVTAGDTGQQPITVNNTGLVTTDVTSVTITGPNAADFQLPTSWSCVANNPPATLVPLHLSPGASCTLNVSFTPTLTTTETATVTLNDSKTPPLTVTMTGSLVRPAAAVTPTTAVFPTTTVGMHNIGNEGLITIANSGPGYLRVTGYQLTGADAGDFVLTADGCTNVKVTSGQSCTVSVLFEPVAPGTRTATLTIQDNDPTSPQHVALTGNANQPSISLSPTSLDFGSQNAGTTSQPLTLQITNQGPGTFFLFGAVNPGWPAYGVSITGPNAADFSWSNVNCYGGMPAGTPCTLTVQFSPGASASGSRTATLVLDDNAAGSPQQIPLTGTAGGPVISASPSPVDFGVVPWQTPTSRVVTVTNVGSGTLSLGPVYVAYPFTVPASTDLCSWKNLAPGGTCTLTLVLTPGSAAYPPQKQFGDLQISQSNASLPVTHVALTWTATSSALTLNPPPANPPSQYGFVFPSTAIGVWSKTVLTVQNWMTNGAGSVVPGASDLHVTGLSITGTNTSDFAIVGDSCTGVSVAPGSTCTVTVVFKPTGAGLRTASLNIVSDAACCMSRLDMAGTGVATATCTSAGLTTAPSSPAAQGSTVTISATTAGCGKPLYRFWIRPPGKAWTVVQNYSSAATYVWNTATYGAGTYVLEVDARDQSSTAAYDATANASYVLATCTAATISANPASPQPPGTKFTIQATASCPGTAQFRFWMRQGTVWTIVQNYGSSSTFNWDSTGRPQGTYGLEVDVRDAGSAATYDTVASTSVTLATPPCATPTLTASPTSPAGTGGPVVLTATTSGCGHPTYRFWMAPPGGAWTVVQPYGAAGSYTWTSTGTPGAYRFEVDVRDQSSTVAYDHVTNLTYTLVACSAAKLTANLASPQSSGATVQFSASATCAGTPEYRFWVRDVSGRWTIAQDYSPSSTFTWNTAGLPAGTYGIEVDVRDHGTTVSYETVANTTFALN